MTAAVAKCTRQGCGKQFAVEGDGQAACYFHPGQPIFHDGLKGWNCCKKRVTTFEEFVDLPGCCTGTHTAEATTAPKPVVTAPNVLKDGTNGVQAAAKVTVGAGGVPTEVYGSEEKAAKEPVCGASPAPASLPPRDPQPEPEDDLSLPVPSGSKCLRCACGEVFIDEPTSRRKVPCDAPPLCTYHPGVPIFHEGSKGYSCCPRKVLEFEEFLKLKGCKSAVNHRFLARCEGEQNKSAALRMDWYQTPTSVIMSIFGKKADKQLSSVMFSGQEVTVDLKLPEGKTYQKVIPLSQPVLPAQCKYEVLTTKVEITLRKANGISWASIEPNENVKTWTTFGVTGGTGTVGSKEMFLASDAPLYAGSSGTKADDGK